VTAALANFILSKPFGFIQDGDVAEIIKLDRLCWLLVRCGAQHGRFSAPAQNIEQMVATIEAAGDWVRDISFPSQCIEEARAFVAALPVAPAFPEHTRLRLQAAVTKLRERKPCHSMDDARQPEEGADWICTGNFDGTTCGSDADPGL
jgi:hypothetical protein